MAEKTYIAHRDGLKVGAGVINSGEAYPAGHLSPSLLSVGWVSEGVGAAPRDRACHDEFASAERSRWGEAAATAAKKGKKAKPQMVPPAGLADVPIAQMAAAAATAPEPTAPATPAKKGKVQTSAKAKAKRPKKG